MKRWLISVCCVTLLLGSVPLLMTTAEPIDPGTGETGTTTGEVPTSTESTGSTDPTESTDATDPTEPTDSTEPTDPTQPAFVFTEYSREYDEVSRVLSVSWNYAEGDGSDVMGVVVGGTSYSVTGSQGRFSATLTGISPGLYPLQYILIQPDGATRTQDVDPVEISGSQTLTITLEVEGVELRALLTDSLGLPVADYPLQFTLNRANTVNQTTDQNGEVRLTASAELTAVSCVAPGRTVGSVRYAGASAMWEKASQNADPQTRWENIYTTTTRSRWSATQPTVTTGTVPTYPTVTGAGTTSIEGNLVAVNTSYDEGVEEAFGLAEMDFAERARLLMSTELYNTLVGDTKATVMMTMGYEPFEITDHHISQLVSGKSKYSRYTHIERVAVDLGMQFVDENGNTVDIEVAPQGAYTVRLPVPKAMTDCPVLAVAVIEENSLSHLIDVQVKNGYLEFVTNGFTSIAVLGFGEGAVRTGGGVAWQLIVLLIAGVLMLAGAALLMYFFVWRKPAMVAVQEEDADELLQEPPAAEEPFDLSGFVIKRAPADTEEPEDGARDLYSQAPEEDTGVDLYSSDDRHPEA